MSAIVMKCVSKKEHPNANSLFVYKFNTGLEGAQSFTIVANTENNYEIDSCAVIVLANSKLKSGEIIRSLKVRGIRSEGMALGVSDLEPGTDVSADICSDDSIDDFIGWPDTSQLFNVRKDLASESNLRKIKYRAKIKLDGTNAGIQFKGDKIISQSRTRVITPESDNYGFAQFVINNAIKLKDKYEHTVIVYGEFCGSGVQKNVAISNIGKRIFCVFCVQEQLPGRSVMHCDPNRIRDFVTETENVYILPWFTDYIELNYASNSELEENITELNKLVDDIEKEDPWVQKHFAVSGVGEGMVLFPELNDTFSIDREDLSDLFFKAKGKEHRVVRTKSAVQSQPELAKNFSEFTSLFVTEQRLEQIQQKIGEPNMRLTKDFIEAFVADVKKESVAELQAAGFEWDDVYKLIAQEAVKWWKNKVMSSLNN